ncbi:hypothetical protein B0H16DRAFT_1511901 [Mycena metata]|uniref:Uncharacterized protein n=1 Tax=Mycena metata TaxID=1033252 RepID=A0AAD7NSI8_9AGAR|nr:hypothetical protein B0H16DRAFT_1511901 [Mycena metata]
MAFPPHPSRIDVVSPASARKSVSRRITSPITPGGVTGLVFPSPLESTPSERSARPLRRVSRINSYSSASNGNFVDLSSDPPQLADGAALDDLWNTLRLEKERKMNKEPPKVKSLEEYKPSPIVDDILKAPSPRPASKLTTSDEKRRRESPAPSAPTAVTPERERRSLLEDALISNDRDSFFRAPSPAPAKAPSLTRRTTSPILAKTATSSSKPSTSSPTPAKTPSSKPRTPSPSSGKTPGLKKKKSITVYFPSPEKNYCVAIFKLRGVDKDDIRVTYRRDHIMVSWELWEVENWEEEDCIARRTVERVYHRVIPLPEGTTVRLLRPFSMCD